MLACNRPVQRGNFSYLDQVLFPHERVIVLFIESLHVLPFTVCFST